MKNFFLGLLAAVALVSLWALFFMKPAPKPEPQQHPPVGASASTDHYNPEYFRNGLSANSFTCLNPVSASSTSFGTIGSAALGSGSCGSTPNRAEAGAG